MTAVYRAAVKVGVVMADVSVSRILASLVEPVPERLTISRARAVTSSRRASRGQVPQAVGDRLQGLQLISPIYHRNITHMTVSGVSFWVSRPKIMRRMMAGRVKGFAPWNPQKRTEPLLTEIEAVLNEYRAYSPLTVRQVFYRLVGKGYPKTENFYSSVGDACNCARRSGRIPFSAIRDDGISQQGGEPRTYESPEEYYATH